MKTRNLLLPFVALTFGLCCSFGCPPHKHYGSVEGVVTAASDGGPIAGAAVIMSDGSGHTDAAGRFRLDRIETGARSVTVTAADFSSAQRSITVQDSKTAQVAVSLQPGPGPDPGTGFMRATIDGRAWAATTREASVAATWLAVGPLSELMITGVHDDAFDTRDFGALGLVLYGPLDSFHPATYAISEGVEDGAGGLTGGAAGFLELGTGSNWGTNNTHTGTVTLTRFDVTGGRIEGTFSFDAHTYEGDTLRTVRNGSFSCPLVVNPASLGMGARLFSRWAAEHRARTVGR